MVTRSLVAAALAATASLWAQPVEFDIPLPDSLDGIGHPIVAAYASTEGLVYLCGAAGGVGVIDGATCRRLGRISTPGGKLGN